MDCVYSTFCKLRFFIETESSERFYRNIGLFQGVTLPLQVFANTSATASNFKITFVADGIICRPDDSRISNFQFSRNLPLCTQTCPPIQYVRFVNDSFTCSDCPENTVSVTSWSGSSGGTNMQQMLSWKVFWYDWFYHLRRMSSRNVFFRTWVFSLL